MNSLLQDTSIAMDTLLQNTSADWSSNDIIPIASMIITLVAVVIGPLVMSRIAKRQTILPMRLARMERLREELVRFTSEAELYQIRVLAGQQVVESERLEIVRKLVVSQTTLTLMVNTEEAERDELLEKVQNIIDSLMPTANEVQWDSFDKNRKKLLDLSLQISKTEWNEISNWRS